MLRIRRHPFAAGILTTICIGTALWACGGYGQIHPMTTSELVGRLGKLAEQDAELTEGSEASEVVSELRRRGPEALRTLLDYRADYGPQLPEANRPQIIQRFDQLIDKVAGQRLSSHSRLYWHTSLADAREESVSSGRPILSLRMLGRLDEEFSCANSRFFRTFLYPDPSINKLLREKFVLHWQSVRDVPVVTIDFGDGRQLRRPLTGNSVHLVLNVKGQPIDALPGLVSPTSFANWLGQASELFSEVESGSPDSYWSTVATYHGDRAKGRRATSKMAIAPGQSVAKMNLLDRRWRELAEATEPVRLATVSRTLVSGELPAEIAMPTTMLKMVVEAPILKSVQQVEPNIARDSVFNLFALQTKIDDWFAARGGGAGYDESWGYDALTDRIYSEVFLMSLSDPWLGLSSGDQFVGLENGGRVQPQPVVSGSNQLSNLIRRELGRLDQ